MALLGPRALVDNALPTGVDATKVMEFEMREGLTPAETIAMAATVIGEENLAIAAEYGGMWRITERLWSRYRASDGTARTMTPEGAEFSDPDGVRSERIGHMLVVDWFKDATSWSVEWLRTAFKDDLTDDIELIRERWRNRLDFQVITRMLSAVTIAVGSAGFSPPWAIGTGTTHDFIPPQYGKYTFTNAHTHFLKEDAAITATNFVDGLDDIAQELQHHGHTGQKTVLMSETDLTTLNLVIDDIKFFRIVPQFADFPGGGNTANPVSIRRAAPLEGIPGETIAWYASDYGLIELKWHPRFPSGYFWGFKSYGVNHPKNPLALRTDPIYGGFGMRIDPQINRSINPKLEKLVFEAHHGVNVNDRLNGVALQIANTGATYDEPTIT